MNVIKSLPEREMGGVKNQKAKGTEGSTENHQFGQKSKKQKIYLKNQEILQGKEQLDLRSTSVKTQVYYCYKIPITMTQRRTRE